MKVINAVDLTDNQWRSYARLCMDIDKKLDPNATINQTTWEVIKKEILSDLDFLKQDFLTCYLFLENEEAVGWVSLKLLGKNAEFVFKGPEDKMYVYMLMDNENIAAFCQLFIREENKHMIDHSGGLTTVGRNYRGQNLAKFLKAKMYLKMLDECPEFKRWALSPL